MPGQSATPAAAQTGLPAPAQTTATDPDRLAVAAPQAGAAVMPVMQATTVAPAIPMTTTAPQQAVAPPHQQIAAALVGATAPHSLTLRLSPEALGQVEIHISRPPDGPASVRIAVERPSTLQLLHQDQPELQRALDQAGLPPDRSISLHLAQPEPPPALPLHTAAAASPGPGQDASSSGMGSNAQGGTGQHANRPPRGLTAAPDTPAESQTIAWQRIGIDVTA